LDIANGEVAEHGAIFYADGGRPYWPHSNEARDGNGSNRQGFCGRCGTSRAAPREASAILAQASGQGPPGSGAPFIGAIETDRDRPPGGNVMLGLMQEWPLLCHRVIDHAAINHADRQVISRSVEGEIHVTTYPQVRARALRVAQRLARDRIGMGDRVATLAWNTWRHLEAWYGILGVGAIYHTVNTRLFTDQIVWIVNHAEDRVMMTDLTFVPLLEKLADRLESVERYVILTDAARMPKHARR